MKVNLYGCGGTGINLVRPFEQFNGKDQEGFATLETAYIDGSDSNVDQSLPKDRTYLVEGLKGSGKLRATNHGAFTEVVNEILLEFRPGDVNVIVHSASGGSGSVIGPLLVNELLSRGELVIVMCVGTTSSKIEIDNTKKTLQSYESYAMRRNTPVCVYYRENSMDRPRADIDKDLGTALTLLTAVLSGQNREFDHEDLRNFLNYQRVTSYAPKLSYLDLFAKDIDLESKHEAIISLVSLSDGTASTEVPQRVEYQATGFLHPSALNILKKNMPLHVAVIAGHFGPIIARLEKLLGEFQEVRSTVHDKPIVNDNVKTTNDGMVL